MNNPATLRVRFIDNGLFMGFARRLAPDFKQADYWSPWVSPFPTIRRTLLGRGWPELPVVPLDKGSLWEWEKVDLWVFLDVFHTDLQLFLVSQGKAVWGARNAEEMELNRAQFKGLLKRVGLPVGDWELITGTTKLREFLHDKEAWFIKGDSGFTRGDMETWKWKNRHISTARLDEIEYDLGAFKDDFKFVVEREIPKAVEIGYDGAMVDGLSINPCMQGIEIKGLGILGVVKPYDKLAAPVKMVNAALGDEFARHEYRGFMCMEMRKTVAAAPFVLDPCCRLGSPSNELLQTMLQGWSKTLAAGAEGRLTNPEPVARYGMVAMVYSEQSGKNWQPLAYPPELDPWVIVRNGWRRTDGKIFSVPQGQPGNIAGVVGVGNSILDAVAKCAEHARKLDGQGIEISLDAIGKALDQIAEGEKYGVKFTEDKLPTPEELKKAVG